MMMGKHIQLHKTLTALTRKEAGNEIAGIRNAGLLPIAAAGV